MRFSKSIIRASVLALALAVFGATPASADQLLGGYWAYIGRADLYNSNGQRLTTARQVLRQDRANLHRFGIWQNGDEWDPYFGSLAAREAMDRLVNKGGIGPNARKILRQGGGKIYVHVYGNANRLTRIRVTRKP